MSTSVKFAAGSDDTLEILAIPFGGPLAGRDTDGEYFSEQTDLCLKWFPDSRPVLYDHGMDRELGPEVIGRADSTTLRKAADGWWVKAQLDRRHRFFEAIKRLIAASALSGSSAALPSLVRKAATGEILVWPWIEQTLTPMPANLYSVVQPVDAAKHYATLGLVAPDWDALKAEWPKVTAAKAADDLHAALASLKAMHSAQCDGAPEHCPYAAENKDGADPLAALADALTRHTAVHAPTPESPAAARAVDYAYTFAELCAPSQGDN